MITEEDGWIHTGEFYNLHCDTGYGCGDKERFTVVTHLQNSAVVVSGRYQALADRQEITALLVVNMEAAAAKIQVMGGCIGHLKASIDVHTVEMFSLTENQVCRKQGNDSEILIIVAAILFAIREMDAEYVIRTMFMNIDRNIRRYQ